MSVYDKTIIEDLDYGWDWSKELGSDAITSSSWLIPVGLTSHTPNFDSNSTSIFLNGGTLGETYECKNTVISAGRTYERVFWVEIVRYKTQ